MVASSPVDHTWLSFNMIILERSCRCGSIPPTIIPYFSTNLKPGVVLRVPAIVPVNPLARAVSRKRFDLEDPESAQTEKAGSKRAGHELGGDATTSSKQIQSYTFSKKNMSCFASDSGHFLHWLEGLAFLHVPFNSAISRSGSAEEKNKLMNQTYVQSSCLKISSTKGTPAKTASVLPFPRRYASRSSSPTTYPP